MPPRVLHHVKPEIRVLGVASIRRDGFYDLVGVVYRGRRWLDGVMRAKSDSPDLTNALSEMLDCSPHVGQVRVIVLDHGQLPEGASVDLGSLQIATEKPVIALRWPNADLEWRSVEGRIPYCALGMGKWASKAVLMTSTNHGGAPEALRVASMLVEVIPD